VSSNDSASRRSWPFALLAVVCAAVVTGVLVSVVPPLSATQFANTGHWVYNSLLGSGFHLDGGTGNIDTRIPMNAEQGSQVLQSDTSVFVVGQRRITEFDKASLTEQRSMPLTEEEIPLEFEVVGGPYLVYRNAGRIVRLGDPTATISVGGAIGNPVVTEDGTMWLHRTGRGQICRLVKDAVTLSGCPVSAPKDHKGALTVVGGRPAFVDLFTSRLHRIVDGEFRPGVALGVRLSPNARPAPRDADGRLAILDPAQDTLVLVDTSSRPAKPVTRSLPSGDYDGPVATGGVVVLVDRQKGTVLTFGVDGEKKAERALDDKTGQPRLSQGEDKRVYVEDSDGTQVVVVGEGGDVLDVDVSDQSSTSTTPVPGSTTGQPTDTGQPPEPPTSPPPVAPSRPGAPPSVAALAGDGSATVTWEAAPDNRAPITSYVVSWQGNNGQTGSVTVNGGARRAPVNDLTNGVGYVITVAATNRVGTGPGASAGPVTPVSAISPAAPPGNLTANYDPAARPTRNVTLTWTQPALGGGTLVHYEVTATGQAMQLVQGNEFPYSGLSAYQNVTFTVRAVTRTPDGQNVAGATATTDAQAAPLPRLLLRKGDPAPGKCQGQPDCAWMHVELVGFAPDTSYDIQPHSSHPDYSNPGHGTPTDVNGNAVIDEFAYTGPGDTVWVTTTFEGNPIESEHIGW
jgi:hypothetical protein